MGRGVDRRTQVARMEAVRSARAKGIAEARAARLQGVIDAAIAEALKNLPQVGAPVQEAAPSAPALPPAPTKPLHEMDAEEWRAFAAQYWPQASARRPGGR